MTIIDNSSTQRIAELDVLRGFAVLGIFWINIVYMGLPYGAINMPTLVGDADALNVFAWVVDNLFIDGSMFALFSMLFGASALILLREEKLNSVDGVAVIDRYYRRLFWLMAFGLIHSFVLLWPLEILFTYGVLGLFLFPLRNIRPSRLLLLGTTLVVIGSFGVVDLSDDNDSSQDQTLLSDSSVDLMSDITISGLTTEILDDIDSEKQLKDELYQKLAEDMLNRKQGYLDVFQSNFDLALGQHTTNLFEDNIYDAGGMMLIGMALFKWGMISGMRSSLFYLAMMIAGYGVSMLLRYPFIVSSISSGFDPLLSNNSEQFASFFARLPLALGHIGLIMLLLRMEWFKYPAAALSVAGKLALTNYIAQTIFAGFLFYSFGLGLLGELQRHQLSIVAFTFGFFQLGFSVYWLQNHSMGPLEQLWRWLTNLGSVNRAPLGNFPLSKASGEASST